MVAKFSGQRSASQIGDDDASDRELLRIVAGGDRKAFDRLYRRYYPRLRDFIGRLMAHRHEIVDEVLNDSMYVVWTKADSFRYQSRVSTWIFGIAYRKALKHFEKEGRNRLEQMPADWVGSIDDSSDIASAAQLNDSLIKALDKLSPSQRSVVELTYEYGYSYAEIAAIMGCPENTV